MNKRPIRWLNKLGKVFDVANNMAVAFFLKRGKTPQFRILSK